VKKYSENYFGAGIIAVEKSRAGPTTTVLFSPVAAKKISGENNGSSWCPFSVSQIIGYENVRWVSHKILY